MHEMCTDTLENSSVSRCSLSTLDLKTPLMELLRLLVMQHISLVLPLQCSRCQSRHFFFFFPRLSRSVLYILCSSPGLCCCVQPGLSSPCCCCCCWELRPVLGKSGSSCTLDETFEWSWNAVEVVDKAQCDAIC